MGRDRVTLEPQRTAMGSKELLASLTLLLAVPQPLQYQDNYKNIRFQIPEVSQESRELLRGFLSLCS